MIKTFIVGADYDDSELNDVVLRGEALILRFLYPDGRPANNLKLCLEVDNVSQRYTVQDDGSFVLSTNLQKPGLMKATLIAEKFGIPVKQYVVPPIMFIDIDNVFSGQDTISRLLDMADRVDAIDEKIKKGESRLNILSELVDKLNKINYDPLN